MTHALTASRRAAVEPATPAPRPPVASIEAAAHYAEAADADRVLAPQVARALVADGFARHFVPTAWGGDAGTAEQLLEITALVGAECTSAAWCGALAAGAARMGAYLPERGQAELWSEGPDVLVAGALIPQGIAERIDTGWRLQGRWEWTSGVDHAGWALVAASVPGNGSPSTRFLALPRHDFRVEDTWFNTGMRGTGSNTLVVDDVVVPFHRTFDREDMLAGRSVGSTAHCHVAPLRAISGLLFAAPALGAARGALRAWSAGAAVPTRSGPAAADKPSAQMVAARSASETDAAELLLRRVAAVVDRGAPPRPEEVVRGAHDCAVATDLLVGVAERLFRTAGSRGQQATRPLQRFWRDVHCLSSHVALQLEPSGVAYGAQLLRAT